MRPACLLLAAAVAGCSTPAPGPTAPAKGETASSPADTAPAATTADTAGPAGEDVTAAIKKLNTSEFAAPPNEFRTGHVSKQQGPRAKKTKLGYEIQFLSRAPIVTPAVYDGKVYVSGGFRSKELHAFEATTGKPAWSLGLDDDGPSAPACDDGVCVINTESCTIFAVNARTGKHLWSWWLGDPLTDAPTIADGMVFTSYPAAGRGARGDKRPLPPGATHALAAFDLRTGKIKWQKWLDASVMSSPVVRKQFVYVTTFAGTLIKFDARTGDIRYAVRARATSAPVIQFGADGLESMYYTRREEARVGVEGDAEEMIIRADHNSPKTRYKARAKKARYLDKKVQAQTVYAKEGKDNDSANGFGSGAPATASAVLAGDTVGQVSVHTMQAFQGSRILHLGDRNVNTMGDEVVATDAATGKELWSYKLKGNIDQSGGALGTAPLSAGANVVFATLAGDIVLLDPTTGKPARRFALKTAVRAQPVVADGWIYVGTEDGRLIAIDTGDRSLTGWPMWGGDAARSGVKLAAK